MAIGRGLQANGFVEMIFTRMPLKESSVELALYHISALAISIPVSSQNQGSIFKYILKCAR